MKKFSICHHFAHPYHSVFRVALPFIFISLAGCASHNDNPLNLNNNCANSTSCTVRAIAKTGFLFTFNTGFPPRSTELASAKAFWRKQNAHKTPLWNRSATICSDIVNSRPIKGVTTRQGGMALIGCQIINLI